MLQMIGKLINILTYKASLCSKREGYRDLSDNFNSYFVWMREVNAAKRKFSRFLAIANCCHGVSCLHELRVSRDPVRKVVEYLYECILRKYTNILTGKKQRSAALISSSGLDSWIV